MWQEGHPAQYVAGGPTNPGITRDEEGPTNPGITRDEEGRYTHPGTMAESTVPLYTLPGPYSRCTVPSPAPHRAHGGPCTALVYTEGCHLWQF